VTTKDLAARVQRLEDIEEIKKLQRAYAYYFERQEGEEILALFSKSEDVSAEGGRDGIFKGQGPEGIKLIFLRPDLKDLPGYIHTLMPLSAIVDVDPDGKTAKGRWYGFGTYARPVEGGIEAQWRSGVYENEYVKEDGKWKIKKLFYSPILTPPYEDGWGKTPYTTAGMINPRYPKDREIVHTFYEPFPSTKGCPRHYKNPVSGK
jgi:hypothetical protein